MGWCSLRRSARGDRGQQRRSPRRLGEGIAVIRRTALWISGKPQRGPLITSLRLAALPTASATAPPPSTAAANTLHGPSRSPVWLTGDRRLCCAPHGEVRGRSYRRTTLGRPAGRARGPGAPSITSAKSPPSVSRSRTFKGARRMGSVKRTDRRAGFDRGPPWGGPRLTGPGRRTGCRTGQPAAGRIGDPHPCADQLF